MTIENCKELLTLLEKNNANPKDYYVIISKNMYDSLDNIVMSFVDNNFGGFQVKECV